MMWIGHKIKVDTRYENIEGGIWDENILVGSGCVHFKW